jgi:hypothetical protein
MTKDKVDNLFNCTIQTNQNDFQVTPHCIFSSENRLEHL